jgi:RimJ/RimL family protein N-acetyltransferase
LTDSQQVTQVRLRSVDDGDLDVFFGHQSDPAAIEMAALPALDKDQLVAHWARIRSDKNVVVRTIVADGRVAGSIGSWRLDGRSQLGYWVGRAHWGRGVATEALRQFVDEVSVRPLDAHVAAHNLGSIRVLEKCGFRRDHVQEATAPAPDDGVQEFIYVLDAWPRPSLSRPRPPR